ncbi:MAG: glycosyltransferase [Candidatus Eisenbacteria bacterium]
MNVAFLIGRFPPHDVGGAERQADRLAASLAAGGHAVTVITRRWPGRAPRERRDGFAIVRTPVALGGIARSGLDTAATMSAIRGLSPRPDVILAFQTFISGAIAGLADATLGIPSVVWVRGENEYRFDRRPDLYTPSKFAWRQARRILVQSPAHGDRLLAQVARRNPLLAERLKPRLDVLGNGVDVPAAAVAGGEDWLYVGRLIAHKGLPVLLDALARAQGTAAERPLWVVGDGPERAALERQAKRQRVDARFVGMVGRADLPAYWQRAAAIVLPSQQGEGLPNALLEAMAAGVPPIATALPGVEELVRGVGRVVAPGDAAALAGALAAMSEPVERRRMALGARARAAARSFTAVAGGLEGVLAAAAQPAPRVWLVAPDPGSAGGVAAVARQMLVSTLSRRYRLSMLSTHRTGSVASRLLHGGVGLGKVALGLALRKPDLVHLKVASRGSFARKLIVGGMCRLRGVPVLVHVHGGGFDRFVRESRGPVRRLAHWLLDGTPQVLSLSERWAERLRPLFPRARIDVLINPVEVARFADLCRDRFAAAGRADEPAAPPTALFLGDLVERKGVYDLVAAWPDVARAVPGARLVLCGSGELDRVRAAARNAGVQDLVDVPGWIGFEEKRRRLREATLFVLPSYIEGVPISLLEAMAAGLPSVVTPVGGVLDAVTDGQEALVVEPGDFTALAQAMIQVLQSRALARALGGSARRRVEAFDITVYAEHLDRIYRMILGSRASAASAPSSLGAAAGAHRRQAAR